MTQRVLLVCDAFAEQHCLSARLLRRLDRLGEVVQAGPDADGAQMLAELTTCTALLLAGWDARVPYLSRSVLGSTPGLRFIGCGQDSRWRHVDVQAALSRGIVCSDSTGAMGAAVAEFTLGLLLGCLRDIPAEHHGAGCAENWSGWRDSASRFPTLLRGRSIGIIGMGGIGQNLVELLRPFGCQVRAWSSHLGEAAAAELSIQRAGVAELCALSDIVVVATQPRRDTTGLVDAGCIARMRPGTVVVLVGRASTVDVDALYRRVLKGDLKLAIDVYEQEPLPQGHPLMGLPNVIHTPHAAGRTIEANQMIVEAMVADLERVAAAAPALWATTAARAALGAAEAQ